MVKNQCELGLREWDFSHGHGESKLVFSNVTMSKFIKVFHKLSNSDSLFFDFSSNSTKKIFKIFRHLVSDGGFVDLRFTFKIDKTISISF